MLSLAFAHTAAVKFLQIQHTASHFKHQRAHRPAIKCVLKAALKSNSCQSTEIICNMMG